MRIGDIRSKTSEVVSNSGEAIISGKKEYKAVRHIHALKEKIHGRKSRTCSYM